MSGPYREEMLKAAAWCDSRAATFRKIGLMLDYAEKLEAKAAQLRLEAEAAPPAPEQLGFGFEKPPRRQRKKAIV